MHAPRNPPDLVNAKGLKVGSYSPRGGTSLLFFFFFFFFFRGSQQESQERLRVAGGTVIRLSVLTEIPVTMWLRRNAITGVRGIADDDYD